MVAAAARLLLRSPVVSSRVSATTRLAAGVKRIVSPSPLLQNPLSPRIFRSPVGMSRICAVSLLPYHSATASSVLTSMLSVSPRGRAWIIEDVPEGCAIIREHIPITNLFTCLWFNEADRFTSRDQLSFSTVCDKIRSRTYYTINMFLDCDFVIQGYHRDILEQMSQPPPPPFVNTENTHLSTPLIMNGDTQNNKVPLGVRLSEGYTASPMKKVPTKRGKDRHIRRHWKIIAGGKDPSSK